MKRMRIVQDQLRSGKWVIKVPLLGNSSFAVTGFKDQAEAFDWMSTPIAACVLSGHPMRSDGGSWVCEPCTEFRENYPWWWEQ